MLASTRTEYHREYRRRNAEVLQEQREAWRTANPERHAFTQQKGQAKRRGIEFTFTFEEWRDWWGEDFALRGKGKGDLMMCRYNDEGAYAPGNVYKGTQLSNSQDRWERHACSD